MRCLQLNFLDEQHAVYLSGVSHSSFRRIVEHRNAGFDLLTKHMVISIMEPWLLGSVSMVLLAFGFSDLLCFKPFLLCQPRSWDYSPSGSSSPPLLYFTARLTRPQGKNGSRFITEHPSLSPHPTFVETV